MLHLILFVVTSTLLAQETPTEREAGRDVLRKIAGFETSLDVPALVAKLTAADPDREQVAARAKQLMETEMLSLGDVITRDPEIGFVEFRAIERLKKALEQHGFEVEVGLAGMKTAFVGRYKRTPATPREQGPNPGALLHATRDRLHLASP